MVFLFQTFLSSVFSFISKLVMRMWEKIVLGGALLLALIKQNFRESLDALRNLVVGWSRVEEAVLDFA